MWIDVFTSGKHQMKLRLSSVSRRRHCRQQPEECPLRHRNPSWKGVNYDHSTSHSLHRTRHPPGRDGMNKKIILSKSNTITKLIERFVMSALRAKIIPANPQVKLTYSKSKKSEGEITALPYPYRLAVGALF